MNYLLRSYAKLNLVLHLYPPLSSGYHPLQSIFQSISLHDVLQISLSNEKGIWLTCSDPTLVVDESNILSRLYRQLEQYLPFGLIIHLEKNIPVGGGLGGGSSNAGALLSFLRMMTTTLSYDMIHETATQLGSDVAFFLTGGRALVSGVGENVTPLPPQDEHYVLIHPGISITSSQAYSLFDRMTPSSRTGCSDDLFLSSSRIGENDFRDVIWREYPIYGDISRHFHQLGLPPLFLSGSGATSFMMVPSTEKAEAIASQIQALYPDFWISVASARSHA
jgi:4-diphosphocytidyl-2-C-methyl-D-erythritol kinase